MYFIYTLYIIWRNYINILVNVLSYKKEEKKMECDKCGNEIRGASVVVDFGCYHLACTDIRPQKGRIADALKKDIGIPLRDLINNFVKVIT